MANCQDSKEMEVFESRHTDLCQGERYAHILISTVSRNGGYRIRLHEYFINATSMQFLYGIMEPLVGCTAIVGHCHYLPTAS